MKLLSLLTYGSRFAFYVLNDPKDKEGINVLRIILLGTRACLSFFVFCVIVHCLILTADVKFQFHLFCGMIGSKFKMRQ